MRATTLIALLILGSAALIVAPAITTGQPGGGFGKKGGGGMLMMQDPNAVFDVMARGRTFILATDSRSMSGPLAQYAQEKGITNGQISRQQFVDFMTQYKAKMAAGGASAFPNQGGGGFGGKGKKGGGGGGMNMSVLPPGTVVTPGQTLSPDAINQFADADFKKKDENGDGKLTREEMPGPLRFSLKKWDKNGDNLIDLLEYREFFSAQLLGTSGGEKKDRGNAIVIEEDVLDARPTVFRAGGKAPDNLPAWFKEFDTDNDGQVALYEWRKGGKALDDFKTWDLNDDGVITMEEASKYQTVLDKDDPKTGKSLAMGGGKKGNRPAMSGSDNGGGFGGFGKGKGNKGGGTDGGGFGKGKGGKKKGNYGG